MYPLLKLFQFVGLVMLVIPLLAAQDSLYLPEGFDVQGHRGARGLKPENTLPAFETALDLGVTTLELDLHFSADGMVVIWHDDTISSDKCGLSSTASADVSDPDQLNAQDERLLISELTWDQIQQYRCDRNPDAVRYPEQINAATPLAGDDYHLVSLEALFVFVETYEQSDFKSEMQRETAQKIHFNIETKRKPDNPSAIGDDFDGINPGAFERAILDLVAQYNLQDRVIIQSFDHRSLWAIRSENETIKLAALTTRQRPDLVDLSARGAAIWSPDYRDLTPALLQTADSLNLLVIPWTVNDVTAMRRLVEMGVDGIITDRPDVLLRLGNNAAENG